MDTRPTRRVPTPPRSRPRAAPAHSQPGGRELGGPVRPRPVLGRIGSLDECDTHDAEPGAYVFGPRLVPHTFQPLTTTADVLVINNHGAIEGYFRSIGPADARHDTDHADMLAHYGVTLLDGPPHAS